MSSFGDLAGAAELARRERPGVPLALATLVQVEGSSYRQPGARLLVDGEGRVLAGAISGGCLEGDVAARAATVCATGRGVRLVYDLRADLETIWGFGAACDGVAHLVLEPLADWRWLARAEDIRMARAGGAVVTVLTADGAYASALLAGAAAEGRWHHLPSSSGSRALAVTRALVRAAEVAQQTAQPVTLPEAAPEQPAVFIEPLVAPVALYLVGAGRGAEAFALIAHTLGWTVTVVDHRPALLEALVVPHGVRTRAVASDASAPDRRAAIGGDARTAVALLSHIFEVDAAWLTALQSAPVAYVGVLGSRRRAAQLFDVVTGECPDDDLKMAHKFSQRLYAPIGLDLGGESPASIALAAIAEIEAVMHGRPGGSLRERQSPIHSRTPTPQALNLPAGREQLAD